MPNKKGGKAYKNRKGGDEEAAILLDRTEDQVIARVVRALGNRNMLMFCEDNRLRIGHIRGKMAGKMAKRNPIEVGDLVLTSFRVFDDTVTGTNTIVRSDGPVRRLAGIPPDARGDILAKYARDQWRELKKESGMNANLFLPIENMEGVNLAELGRDKARDISEQNADEMGGFEFDRDGDSDDSDSSGVPAELKGPAKARGARMGGAAAAPAASDDELDIDGI